MQKAIEIYNRYNMISLILKMPLTENATYDLNFFVDYVRVHAVVLK
jgi:hypothetical protein